MRRLRLLPCLLQALTAISAVNCAAQVVDVGCDRNFPSIYYKGKVFIGTPTGLSIYDFDADIWTSRFIGETIAGNRINVLGVDEEILWMGTNGGVATTDLRLGDLIVYTEKDGLPSDTILGMAFEEDYVWVGTPSGTARFDKLTGTWRSYGTEEGLLDSRVSDVLVAGGRVWFATAGGVSEYDSEQEVFRSHHSTSDIGLNCDIVKLHASSKFIWSFSRCGVRRYDVRTRLWTSYTNRGTGDGTPTLVVSEGDSLWVVVEGDVFLYDPNIDAFTDFEYSSELGERRVTCLSLSPTEIWVSTDRDVARLDRVNKTWKFHGVAQGLSASDFLTVNQSGGIVFACAADGSVHYLKTTDQRWYLREAISPAGDESRGRVGFTAEERGTGLLLPLNNELLIKGNTTWILEGTSDGSWREPEGRSDLVLIGKAFGGRALSGKYDDTDLEKTVYGIALRGKDRDILRKASLGHERCEFGRDVLVRSLDMFGASVDLGVGKVESGTSRVGLSMKSGERQSGFDSDFFIGRMSEVELAVRDVDYVQGVFFDVDDSVMPAVITESETLYLDDGRLDNNTPNTKTDTTIAGVNGDFDILYPLVDYVLDGTHGVFRIDAPVDSQSILGVDYRSPVGRRELILWSDTVRDHELVNRYSLGLNIIPRSLSVVIVDTSGEMHNISEFGLDRDSDGRVDPEFVEHREGILKFPVARPFPDEIYDSGTHIFTMNVSYSVSSPTYSLSHRRIVRLSETVRLDGAVLARGDDYIIDYTSGTLVMLREELVGERSQIDITYEFERDSDEEFHMFELNSNPNKNLRASIRGIRFDDDDSGLQQSDLAQASLELRTRVLGLDIRAPIELARGIGDTLSGMAQHYSLYVSGAAAAFRLGYRSYEKNFHSVSQERGRLGDVRTIYNLGYESDITDWLLGETELEHQTFFGDSGLGDPVALDGRTALTFGRQGLPALTLWFRGRDSETDLSDERLLQIGSDLGYSLTKEEFARLPVRSLTLGSSLARTWWRESLGDSAGRYDGGSVRVVSTLFRGVSFGSEYSAKKGIQDSPGIDESSQTSRSGEIKLSSSIDRIPGFAMYGKLERDADETPYGTASNKRNAGLEWRDYARVGVYPGVWFNPLSLVDFEYEISSYVNAHLQGVPAELSLGERYWHILESLSDSRDNSRTQNLKGHVRPHVSLLADLAYERTREREQVLDSHNAQSRDRYRLRLEYTPRHRSTVTLYHDQTSDRFTPLSRNRTLFPSVWWEERWASWILTKSSISYLFQETSEGVVRERITSMAPQLSTTVRLTRLPIAGDVELTNDASVRYTRAPDDGLPESTVYATAFQVDIKPRRLLRLRAKLDFSYDDGLSAATLITLSGTF